MEDLFLRALCLCHTVQLKESQLVEVDGDQIDSISGGQCGFIASSPDEVALVKGAMK